MMTLEQLVDRARASRRSRICAICGAAKKTEYAFCPRCYYKLAPEQQNPLLSSDVENYLRGYVECYQLLTEEEEHAAQRILGRGIAGDNGGSRGRLAPSTDQLQHVAKSVRLSKAELDLQSRQRHLEAHLNGWD
jgi:IS1 family transposase